MKKNMIRFAQLTALSTSLLSLNSFAYYDPNAGEVQPLITQLQALNNNVQVVGNRMQALAETNMKSQNGSPNLSILQSMNINPVVLNGFVNNATTAFNSTSTDIMSQLQPMSDNLLEVGNAMIDSNALSQRLIADNNQKLNLSINLPASDTIYSNDPTVIALAPSYTAELPTWGIAQPSAATLHNDYFNFGSLIEPVAYTPNTDQATAAQNFVTFLTQGYNTPATGINYSLFQSKLAQAQNPTDKISLYIQLLQDTNYRNYQLSARSATASRSVAVNNFQNLIAERTPVTGLGTQAGLVDSNNNPIPNASPLQIESYLASHRVNSTAWYTQVQTEPLANVQRETLVVLAEIEAQNFQAHLDNERLIATLSAQLAANSIAASQLTAAQANQVNNDIQGFTLPSQAQNNSNASTSNNSAPSS